MQHRWTNMVYTTMRTLCATAAFALGIELRAQADQDSLRAIWEDPSRPDSVRFVARFDMIGHILFSAPPDSSLGLAQELAEFARRHKRKNDEANALNLCGIFYNNMGQFDSAEACYLRSLHAFKAFNNRRGMGMMLNNLGNLVSEKGDQSLAIEHYTNCLRIAEELGDSSLMARVLGNTGTIYHAQGDMDQAMVYYDRRIVYADAIGDKQCAEEAWICKALVHRARNDRIRAMECYQKALALAQEVGDVNGVYTTLANLGELAVEDGDHVRAMALLDSSLAMARDNGDPKGMAAVLTVIARSHLLQGELDLAREQASRSLELAREVGSLEPLRDAAEINYKIFKARRDEKNALAMHEFYITLRDSIVNNENKKAIMQQKFQYDYDKKEALLKAEQDKKDAVAAEELRRKNLQRNTFIGGFGLMILLAGVFLVQRNRIGKEKKRSEELLLNILPEEVAEELKAKGSAEAVHIDQVTVLFTDFKGFTAMSEVLSPRDLVRDLNECFSAFDHITGKYGIEKIKTIGDAYMAAGGLPTPNTTHATDVINAALEMRDFIAEGKAQKIAAGLPYFEIRIGVHTGPVVAGIVGVKKFQYDIWGDTVNTASRMESSGEVGQVNISEATYKLVVGSQLSVVGLDGKPSQPLPRAGQPTTDNRQQFVFTPRGKVRAKGKGEMEMYFVHHS